MTKTSLSPIESQDVDAIEHHSLGPQEKQSEVVFVSPPSFGEEVFGLFFNFISSAIGRVPRKWRSREDPAEDGPPTNIDIRHNF
jgi:hypothetical protein